MDDLSAQAQPDGALQNTGVHEPFTLTERFEQLAEIDNDIIKLLSLANGTVLPLLTPVDTAPDSHAISANSTGNDTESRVTSFKEAMDSFLTTLHAVDVRLKRQIWGLEEAGIISLKESKSTGVSLEPNGVGDIGTLDIGLLNSTSSKIDREMEAELWATMRATLEHLDQDKPSEDTNGAQRGTAIEE
ncbi:hypothetical protein SEPCBS119000_002684 [Sporothrix epigloea]|uniref:Mediator of RNA polymerase II transcription subunit 11 n=1 Tax=Sporothrix epigloea TaxID=1892477 RepID=A0ABP0DKT7_9PEZI